jgi:hypothetical protein
MPLERLIKHQDKATQAGKPISWTAEFTRLTSIYGFYSADSIIDGTAPIKPQLDDRHKELLQHELIHASSGKHAFYAIILDELIRYLENPDMMQEEMYRKYIED